MVIFTKPYTTDVLTLEQIEFIAGQLPSPKATTGRPAYTNQELLPGILRVLRSGCRWRDLNLPGYPDGSTHWRRLRLWRRGLHFRRLWQRILKLLDEQKPEEKANRLKRFSIDGTLLPSFEFKEKTGYSGKHRRVGVKASFVVDATGLPLSAVLASGNVHDVSLAEESVSGFVAMTISDQGCLLIKDTTQNSFASSHSIKASNPTFPNARIRRK